MKRKLLKLLSCALAMSIAISSIVSADTYLPNKVEKIQTSTDKYSISKNEIPIFAGAIRENRYQEAPKINETDKRKDHDIDNRNQKQSKSQQSESLSVSENEIPVFAGVPPMHQSINISNKEKEEQSSISGNEITQMPLLPNEKPSVSQKPSIPSVDIKGDFIKDAQQKEPKILDGSAEYEDEDDSENLNEEEIVEKRIRLGNSYCTIMSEDMKTAVITKFETKAVTVKIPKTITVSGQKFTVTEIGENAFKGMMQLKSISIPSSITVIGKSAFAGCSSLTKVIIPKNVTQIGTKAFYNCKKLKNITIKASSAPQIGSKAFVKITKKAIIRVPKKDLAAYKETLKGKIPSSVVIK